MATILVADEHSVDRRLLAQVLDNQGHRVLQASNGQEALARVRAERPDLVMADLRLSLLDGLQLMRHLRAEPELADRCILLYSAGDHDREAAALAWAWGVQHLFNKQADPKLLVSVVNDVLTRQARIPGQPADQLPRTEQRVVPSLAAQLAACFENARRLEETERDAARLGQEIAERRRVEEELRQTILQREQAEQQLKQANLRLHDLADYQETAREEERTRIAREVHDELGQALTGLKMDLAWLRSRLARFDLAEQVVAVRARAEQMSTLIDSTIQTVRRIATELRPGLLDDLGLAAAAEWQAEEFQRRSGIRCVVSIDLEDVPLARHLATALFRILQETLTNIARHAEATRAKIGLKTEGQDLLLTVVDDGRGITEAALAKPGSFGLLGMRERTAALGGDLRIEGQPGKGTTVTARIPLQVPTGGPP